MINAMTLLAIFAHPDDEAFGTGGTLARYAAAGMNVKLICATRGEAGKITDPEIDSASDVAELREQELRAACEAMGIGEPIFLGFHDSGRQERTRYDDSKALMNVDEGDLEQALLPHIGEIKPDVMLTFDPHGIYGHIDHIKIHRAATAAFWSAGKVMDPAPRRLFYSVMAAERMKQMQAMRERSPMSELDPELYGVSDESFAAILDVSKYREQKEAAVRAHRTQVGPSSSFAGMSDEKEKEVWEEMFMRETFSLGGLRGSFPEMPVADLFVGLGS